MFRLCIVGVMLCASFASQAAEGVLSIKSQYSVQETADKFVSLAESKGLNVFGRIDHSKNAEQAGLSLRPTQVIIFGNPKVGTPLMQCAQSLAIDLPQKVLVSQDENQQVWLSYNDPQYLKQRHDIKGCDPVIEKVSQVLSGLGKASVQ
ncbi:DUF302 domain-containing protein [Marinomonas sp.]